MGAGARTALLQVSAVKPSGCPSLCHCSLMYSAPFAPSPGASSPEQGAHGPPQPVTPWGSVSTSAHAQEQLSTTAAPE